MITLYPILSKEAIPEVFEFLPIALPAIPFPGALISFKDTEPFAIKHNTNNFIVRTVEYLANEPAVILRLDILDDILNQQN